MCESDIISKCLEKNEYYANKVNVSNINKFLLTAESNCNINSLLCSAKKNIKNFQIHFIVQ